MVTAAQLQILQSPIAALISTSVNVKLDDTNYLNWHFQMKLLLESNGICGFVDGTHPCPMSTSADECDTNVHNSPSTMDCDDALVWRMHDRAVTQLITATLSSVAMTCAIGSTSSKDLWNRLKEQFSTVSRTSIFQMKSNLQNIRKGADSITQYLLKIKEARDYLSAAGVYFADEDIVILALNGPPPEYNTFRCVIRGRENVISLKECRSQLLAEESIVENLITSTPSYLTAMHTISKPHVSSASSQVLQQSRGPPEYNSYGSGGFKPFNKAQKWIKETGQSCSTVAALVSTVVFAAAYTVPGGSDEKGRPIFINSPYFLIFTATDVVSLASSLTSLVMFLSLLTSPFELQEFHTSLPRKLIVGLFFLFFSVLTTMISFGATIMILIQTERELTTLLLSIASFLPVFVFGIMQFGMFVSFMSSTLNIRKIKSSLATRLRWGKRLRQEDEYGRCNCH